MIRRNLIALGVAIAGLVALPAVASAGEEILPKVEYEDATTFQCRTDAIPIQPGQNLNPIAGTRTCPTRSRSVSGPGDTSIFAGSNAAGLHHSVQAEHGGGLRQRRARHPERLGSASASRRLAHAERRPDVRFGGGEDEAKMPQGYGIKVGLARQLGPQSHDPRLNAEGGRQIYITWEMDSVPESSPQARHRRDEDRVARRRRRTPDLSGLRRRARLRPDGDGAFTFPDDVPTRPGTSGVRGAAGRSRRSRLDGSKGGRTLVFGAGHLHPGGSSVDLEVARDGPTPGTSTATIPPKG